MISAKKLTAITTAVFLFSGVFATNVSAAPKPTAKPATNNGEVQITCKPSKATGHREKKVSTPKIQKFTKNKVITVNTNCGEIVIEAYAKKAPVTVSMLSGLVASKFYDQSVCHRMIYSETAALLQCGDPTASGYGGPQFQFDDENLPKAVMNNYPAGTVAMANSGPNTNGSQFFIMAANTTLDPNYTVWGRVTKGLEIVQAVVANGTATGEAVGQPKVKIAIEKVSIR
jgi:peptidyl-prolyl cis-trans isomerase B (cyclophilin B)